LFKGHPSDIEGILNYFYGLNTDCIIIFSDYDIIYYSLIAENIGYKITSQINYSKAKNFSGFYVFEWKDIFSYYVI